MGEIRSSWEIARERISKLGKLSDEEKKQQRETKLRQDGNALAQKYLFSGDMESLLKGINRYEEQEHKLVKQAILAKLAEAVTLGIQDSQHGDRIKDIPGIEETERSLKGILAVEPGASSIVTRINQMIQEYHQARENLGQELEKQGRETLRKAGISGTAVAQVNITATGEWQERQRAAASSWEGELAELRQEITRLPR
jgi:hypothetical protein